MSTAANTLDELSTLSPDHISEIISESAINPDVAQARGYRTLYGTKEDRAELSELGFSRFVVERDETYPALLIPLYRATGEIVSYQIKPADPRVLVNGDGKPRSIKYETPKGSTNHVDVPKFTQERLSDLSMPLWITEGMKKTDCLVSHGRTAIGLTGVFNWRSKLGTLGDWEDIPLKGRSVVICFDSDAKDNRNVQLSMRRLGAWLSSKKASSVYYLIVPSEVEGKEVKGVDDYFAAGGSLKGLQETATKNAPGEGPKDAAFTDAVLTERACEEALEGSFCWARGIGWLAWNGHVWNEVADTRPTEAIRTWALDQFQKVLSEQGKDPSRDRSSEVSGWRSVLSKGRIKALVDLSRGIIEKDPSHFDSDPHLLCVKNGYVDLKTGKLHSPDPDKLMTRSAECAYDPEAEHKSWEKVLEAIPEESRGWYHDRIGQAATGYMTPDDLMIVAHGDGENGKSTLVSAIQKTLGTYAVLMSDRVLMASPDAHPTELMDLRGARYAVLEETPEARRLDVHRLKRVVGTETITARRIRQDDVTFQATHSLFVNTNFRPIVTETDHGTWRRLALLSFPYTYRKPGEPLRGPLERPGDPLLRAAKRSEGFRQAVLAWIVRGAQAWFSRGQVMLSPPDRVRADTLAWRGETDLIMGFASEALEFIKDARIKSKDLHTGFNEWVEGQGHKPWTDSTFSARFRAHDIVKSNGVEKRKIRWEGKNSAPVNTWLGVTLSKGGDEYGQNPFDGGLPGANRDTDVIEHLSGVPGVPAGPDYRKSVFAIEGYPEVPEHPEHPWNTPGGSSDRANRTPPGERPFGDDLDGQKEQNGQIAGDRTEAHPEHPEHLPVQTAPSTKSEQHEEQIVNIGQIEHEPISDLENVLSLYQTHFSIPESEDSSFQDVETPEEPDPIFGRARGATGFDLETRGTDWMGWPSHAPGSRPFISLAGWGGRVDTSPDTLCARLRADGTWVGHHVLGFDLPALARHTGFPLAGLAGRVRDTELQAMLADPPTSRETKFGPGFKSYSLDAVLNRVLGISKDVRGKELAKKYGGWENIPSSDPDFREYCREDVARTEDLHSALPWTPYMEREMRVQLIMAQMTLNGFRIDEQLLSERIADGEGRKRKAISVLQDAWGLPTGSKNPIATKKGKEWLRGIYERFGVKNPPLTEKGSLSTSATQLRTISEHVKCPHELKKILDLMGTITSERTIYGTIQEQMVNGRVHVDIWPRQASGRWSAGFFTTMGKRGERVREREVFLPESGERIVSFDLGQIDARIVAAHAQDENYLALFAPGKDIHSEIALQIFGSADFRQDAKALGHGANYGMSENRMIRDGHDPAKVRAFFLGRGQNFPGLIEWTNEIRSIGASGNLLDNGFGRPLRVETSRAYTQAPAQIGQSGTRDMMAEGLLDLVKTAPEVLPMLRGIVHDEIVMSIPISDVEEVSRMVVGSFERDWAPKGKSIPVSVIAGASTPGENWAGTYGKQ